MHGGGGRGGGWRVRRWDERGGHKSYEMCCCVLALPQVSPITRVPGYQHQCLFCPGAIKSGGYLEPRLIFPAIAHISTSEMDRSPSRWLALRIEYLPAPRVYPTVLWALNEVFATITSPPPHPENSNLWFMTLHWKGASQWFHTLIVKRGRASHTWAWDYQLGMERLQKPQKIWVIMIDVHACWRVSSTAYNLYTWLKARWKPCYLILMDDEIKGAAGWTRVPYDQISLHVIMYSVFGTITYWQW